MRNNIVGIDLGTTFSSLAYLNEMGSPEIVPNADGERIMRSAIYFDESDPDRILIGEEANQTRRENPSRCVKWIKREMGDEQYHVNIDGKEWTPPELSALILKKLKQDCAATVGEITEAVITVPAYFDDVRRKATMDAGHMAGLDVKAIVNEPTAAALCHATTHQVSGRILVYDLGGGTFDVTIMDISGRDIEVVGIDGDHRLGGVDFDNKLVSFFEAAYRKEYNASLLSDEIARVDHEDLAERTKHSLSKKTSVRNISLRSDAGNVKIEVTANEFEEAISSLVGRIDMLIEAVLDDAKCKPADITQVLLVGGSTRMPFVRKRLEKLFGFAPTAASNVDEYVALGAALHAGLTALRENPSAVSVGQMGGLKDVKLRDVTSKSYGTIALVPDEETQQQKLVNTIILPKNTPIPVEKTETFCTNVSDQKVVDVKVTEGDSDDPEYVRKITEVRFELPPGRPAGRPIDATYSYDHNQRMHCRFEDKESGRVLELDFEDVEGRMTPVVVERKAAEIEDFTVE